MTNFNERTNTLLYKIISLTLYSRKGWCWLCVRGELETETDCYILTPSSSDQSSTSSTFWLGCLTVGYWGPQALSRQADSQTGILSPNWLQLQLELTQAVCGTWLYNSHVHLLPLFLRLFTHMHLLIDGLVEDQYITTWWFKKFRSCCKNLDDQAKSGRPKTVEFEVGVYAIEVNLVSCTGRISGEFGIS